jgi:uncharacterized membrane protein YpjA
VKKPQDWPRSFAFWLLVIGGIAGAAYGVFFFYREQLAATSPLLWVFVPDCPLAAFLIAVSLLAIKFLPNARLDFLHYVSSAFALKYGFWTMFVLAAFPGFYFTPQSALLFALLFAGHFIVFFEPLFLLGKARVAEHYTVAVLAFFVLSDLSDYLLGTHPPLPADAGGAMLGATLVMSIVFAFVARFLLNNADRPIADLA